MERMLAATAAAEDTHAWFRSLRRVARMMLDSSLAGRSIDRIVDCGAGTGRNTDWLAEFGRPVGIELTPLAVAVARARHRPIVRGTVVSLPFPDRTFDLATSFDVLYCLDDASEKQALSEMWRVLKPGGVVLINVAAFGFLRGSHSTLTHEVRRYTRASLTARLRTTGFTVERVTYTNASLFLPTFLVRAYQRVSGRVNNASDADLQVPSPLVNGTLDRILTLESAWLSRMNLPLGTSVMALGRKPL
jgi:SAM-dependent methyltransferase